MNDDTQFRALWGRGMNPTERAFFDARDSGYTGWFDFERGRAITDDEHRADVEAEAAAQEAAGLSWEAADRGWVPREDAAERDGASR